MPLTPDEQKELESLRGGLSLSEEAELAHLQGPSMSAGDVAKGTLRGGIKALDYQGGAVRGGLAKLVESLGGPKTVSTEEIKAAMSPLNTQRVPGMGEMMERAGVPEGPHLGPVSARGAAGFVGDVVTDPLTYESGLTSIAARWPVLGRLIKPSAGVARDAQAAYRSGVRPIVQAGERFGHPDVAKTMMQEGIWGSPHAIEGGMEKAAERFKSGRDAILDSADAAGAGASKEAALRPMSDELAQMVKDERITQDQAAKIFQDLTAAKQSGADRVPTRLMTQWKTDVGHALPGATWDELSKSAPSMANKVAQTTRAGYRQEVENAVSKTLGAESGGRLVEQNRQLGDMIVPEIKNAASKMASGYEKSAVISPQDLYSLLVGGGSGAASGHTVEGALTGLAASKLLKASQSTAVKTGLGLAGERAMKTKLAPTLDATVRRSALNFSPYKPAEEK